MKITLISPNVVMQKRDLFGSGIPYFPLTMAYAASFLRFKKVKVQLIDSFGENPFLVKEKEGFYYQGLPESEVVKVINKDADAICIFAERLVAHSYVINLIKVIKSKFKKPVLVIENSQAVTSYSLTEVADEFLKLKVDYLVLGGDGERIWRVLKLIRGEKVSIDGIIYKNKAKKIVLPVRCYNLNGENMYFPAWDLFKLENYWKLHYAHAPLGSKKYLPILTSWGCPFHCKFCVTPSLNKSVWIGRNPKNVVDEMEDEYIRYGVKEFHLEDLNPTVDKKRIIAIAKEILNRGLKIKWKFASGIKIETIDEETINWIAKSGCNFVSFSPESGSESVLRLMNKKFKYEYALKIVSHLSKLRVFTQACFVLGFPGEKRRDLDLTQNYINRLVKAGVTEIALFIITPVPGSYLYRHFSKNIALNKLTFSPKWRKDYQYISQRRIKIYFNFLLLKLVYSPIDLISMFISLTTKKFNTKITMTIYRYFRIKKLLKDSKIF